MIDHDALVEWLGSGERGISSNTIVHHLTGVKAIRYGSRSHPLDPADLRRCLLLLEAVPSLKKRFYEMASASKTWAVLTAHWKELSDLLESECPNWRDPDCRSMAKRTYARMKELGT